MISLLGLELPDLPRSYNHSRGIHCILQHFPRYIQYNILAVISMSRFIEELCALALCAKCLKVTQVSSVNRDVFDDKLPNLPNLLRSACDLCWYVREIILSEEAGIFLRATGNTRLATETIDVTISREINPEVRQEMRISVELHLPHDNRSEHRLYCSIDAISGM